MQLQKAEAISTSFIDCVIYPERHFSHIRIQPTSAKRKFKNSEISILREESVESAIR
jgi:hypothetical protein